MQISLAQAQTVINAALAHAAQTSMRPLAVAVVDAGGHIIAVQRQDGAAYLRADIAVSKAAGALALGISSRTISELAAVNPAAIVAVGAIAPRGVIASPGASAGLNALAATGQTSQTQ